MVYQVATSKQAGLSQVTELVAKFDLDKSVYKSSAYNETQFRNDFLNPLLKSLGWDVDNERGMPQHRRDVIMEEPVAIPDEATKKNPDCTLRVGGARKIFVEAKKPLVDISTSPTAAFQLRRYGWSASLGISVLTNFDKLVVYDCRFKPDASDNEQIARVHVWDFTEYSTAFEEIYDLLSFESVASGNLDQLFSLQKNVGQPFDYYFLFQIEGWRQRLAESVIRKNAALNEQDVNFLIQRLLNRIIFLRICEDRTIEQASTLQKIQDYNELKTLFQQSDKKYNSGLFDFIEDGLSLSIDIEETVLVDIFNELYYPQSPYSFAVIDSAILSQIYERFLGSHIEFGSQSQVKMVKEPEIVASNGVVPTPKLIVEQIVQATLGPLTAGKSIDELQGLKIADICCGSGSFLISAFEFLVNARIELYRNESVRDPELIYQGQNGEWLLSLKSKRDILVENIYGIDINPYAIEVVGFSLLLKLLDGETSQSIDHFVRRYKMKALPSLSGNIKCGNSLVDNKFYKFMPAALSDHQLSYKVKPFEWIREYSFLKVSGGFDAIIGNPPYVRIQNLVKYTPEEIKYYQSGLSGYLVASKETVDKYFIFIQKALTLLAPGGLLGYIVPHKFFINKSGKSLREFITNNSSFSTIVHFGTTQVFEERSTYTAIIILQKEHRQTFGFKRVRSLSPDFLSGSKGFIEYSQDNFKGDPWIFLSTATSAVFSKLTSRPTAPLGKLTKISVGLQTSKDSVYIFEPIGETDHTFLFELDQQEWEIEKDICKPCILDLSFDLFETISPNAQMIFPYKIIDGEALVIEEQNLQNNYPLCWQYLEHNKTVLAKRDIAGKDPKWYQFGRAQSIAKLHNVEKLIWPVLATKPCYVLDQQNIQFTGGGNGPYYSLLNDSQYSLLYFMAVLRHPVIEYLIKAGASEFRGDYYSHGKQFMENLPVPEIDLSDDEEKEIYENIVVKVKLQIEIKQQMESAYGSKLTECQRRIEYINSELTSLVNRLYDITEEDIEAVAKDEQFTTGLIIDEE